jgi:hypothetical protein
MEMTMDATRQRPIIFLGGSIAITVLPPEFEARLDIILSHEFDLVLGDAGGADLSIQRYLAERHAANVTIFCSGNRPRRNMGGWPVRSIATGARPGTRAFHTAKDQAMARIADYGLMAWNGRSPGTLGNVGALADRKRPCVVFIAPRARFVTVSDKPTLSRLVSESAGLAGR